MKTILGTMLVSLVAGLCGISGLAQNTDTTPRKGQVNSGTGVLLLAHGGKEEWNKEVMKVAAAVNESMPVEVAFGMANKRSIQDAINRLTGRGVKEIVAVPLFISPHSSVVTSTEYLLGKRKDEPSDLAMFAKMDHGSGGHGGEGSHGYVDKSFDPTTPVKSSVPIRMTSALGAHPLVAEILLTLAADISQDPKTEVLVIVAHGPVSDEENALWLADIRSLVDIMATKSKYKRVEFLTVRDDAPEPIYKRATEDFRAIVKRGTDAKDKILIVPLLLSYGGIEEGIKKRLDGLDYRITKRALLPDDRLARWVLLQSVKGEIKK